MVLQEPPSWGGSECREWAEVAARISVEGLPAVTQAGVLVTSQDWRRGRGCAERALALGPAIPSLRADGLRVSFANGDGSPGAGGAAGHSASPVPTAALGRGAALPPLPPRNLRPELAVTSVPATLPVLQKERAARAPLRLHTVPAAGLGEAERILWAGRSRPVAGFGRGLPKREQRRVVTVPRE